MAPQKALDRFLSLLPKEAEIAVHGEAFFFEGRILERDEIHILLSDGAGIYLARLDRIETFLYVPPDSDSVEIVAPEKADGVD